MKLRAEGFNTNGTGDLRGTLIAVADDGILLGFEHRGNFSNMAERGRLVAGLVCECGVAEDIAKALVAQALKSIRQAADSAPEASGASRDPERPIVVVNGRYLREVAVEAWKLLSAPDGQTPKFYRVGNSLTHMETEAGRVYPRVLRRDSLIGHLDRLADFVTVKEEEYRPARPPKDVAEDMLAAASPPMPRLQAVVNTPVVAPDGTCLTADGYYPGVQLYLDLKAIRMPTVPERPLSTDINRARSLILDELLVDFPFTTSADRAHAVASLITPMARPLIDGPTPLFLFDAPSPGTGKGLLAEVVVTVNTGGPPAMMTEGRGVEEWRKRITAVLMEVPSIVVIDNIRDRLDAAPLASALTAPIWQDRVLGESRVVRVPVRCCWIATGNNVSMSMEMARRTVQTRLDAAQERPWERQGFRHEPLTTWTRANRGELCWAALTLIRGWIAAGRPEGGARLGGFEAWSHIVGGILRVAGIEGFLGNRSALYAQSEAEAEGWLPFITVWWERFGDTRIAVDELFKLAKEARLLTELRSGRNDHGARVSLGMTLASVRDRRIGDYWIRDMGKGHGGGATYRLDKFSVSVGGQAKKDSPDYTDSPDNHICDGETGETGESFSDPNAIENNFSEPCKCPVPEHFGPNETQGPNP